MQPEIRTVAAKAWPWRTLQIRGLCPKRAEGRARVSSRHGQQFVTTHLKMRRVARPDGVAPRTAHPPSSLCRVLPPMRLFWRALRPFSEFAKFVRFFEFVPFTTVSCRLPQYAVSTPSPGFSVSSFHSFLSLVRLIVCARGSEHE